MRFKTLAILAGVVAGAMTQVATGTIYVNRFTLTGGCSTGCITPYSSGQSINITTTNNDYLIYIYSNVGNEDIGRVTVTFSGGGGITQTLALIIGDTTANAAGEIPPEHAGGRDWAGLDVQRDKVQLNARITGDLTDSVIAGRIKRFETEGTVDSYITQGLSFNDSFANENGIVVIAGEITDDGGVQARGGYIQSVETTGDGSTLGFSGNMLGAIVATSSTANNGYIGSITAAGDIGATGVTPIVATIKAANPGPSSSLHIASISANDCVANISGPTVNDFVSIGDMTVLGDFGAAGTGSSIASFDLLEITGDLDGELRMNGIGATQTLRIGGSLIGDVVLSAAGSSPLAGQIIINAGNGAGTWSGNILLDTTELEQEYADAPNTFGGGAAGLAPFNAIHDETANIGSPGYVFITGLDIYDPELECVDYPFDGEVIFQLYGPVSIESGSGTPAKVQVRTGPTTWTDAFDIDAEIVSSTGSRGLKFVRKDGSGNPIAWPQTFGEYRIVPKTDRIVSVDVAGTPTAEFEYYIELADGCAPLLLSAFDLNSDETLCAADIACWTGNPVDLNNDSNADGDDVTLLINAVNAYNN